MDQLNEKLNVLLKEKNIEEEIRTKIQQENEILKKQLSDIQKNILDLEDKFTENKIEEEELKFLKLNLKYGHKCRKTFFNDLYKVGTTEYRNCVLDKEKN